MLGASVAYATEDATWKIAEILVDAGAKVDVTGSDGRSLLCDIENYENWRSSSAAVKLHRKMRTRGAPDCEPPPLMLRR